MSFLDSLDSSFIDSDLKSDEKVEKEKTTESNVSKGSGSTTKSPSNEEDASISHKKRNLSQMNEPEQPKEKSSNFFDSLDDSSIDFSDLKTEPTHENEDQSPLAKKKPKFGDSSVHSVEDKKSEKESNNNADYGAYMSSFDSPFRALGEKPQPFPFQPPPQQSTVNPPQIPSPSSLKSQKPFSSNVFNRDAIWKEEDKLSLEMRRRRYHFADYVAQSTISHWETTSKSLSVKPVGSGKYSFNPDINKKIALWHGNITRLEIDGIVNAANVTLRGGAGVDGAIHSASGPKLLDECIFLDGCETGQSKITRGYDLPAKYVIHTVGPTDEDGEALKSCYKTSLEVTTSYNLRSIAFCGISTGIYGFPLKQATEIALSTVRDWLEVESNRNKVDLIIFCTFLQKEKECYENLAFEYFPIQSAEKTQPQLKSGAPLKSSPPLKSSAPLKSSTPPPSVQQQESPKPIPQETPKQPLQQQQQESPKLAPQETPKQDSQTPKTVDQETPVTSQPEVKKEEQPTKPKSPTEAKGSSLGSFALVASLGVAVIAFGAYYFSKKR